VGIGVALLAAGCSSDSSSGPDPDPAPDGISLSASVVTVFPETIEPGQTSTLTLHARAGDGSAFLGGGLNVGFSTSGGTTQGQIGTTTDQADGTFTAVFTGATEGSATNVLATINGSAVTSTAPTLQVTFVPALVDTTGAIPLIDMQGYSYRGFPGLLYPGSNTIPSAHVARQPPIDTSSQFVLLSIGMSNAKMEFCDQFATRDSSSNGGQIGPQGCASWSFMGQVWGDPALNDNLMIVSGAQGGRDISEWDDPTDPTYMVVASTFNNVGATADQVQIIWAKQATIRPTSSLPASNADAFDLLASLGDVLRTVKIRYPNVKQFYFSSRMYSYGSGGANDEPYAYETGLAMKWVIEAQINQLQSGGVDAIAGDLGLDVAPWVAWGPYLWANGMNARSDGLSWSPSEMMPDGTHPWSSARQKIGGMIKDFFMTSPLTTPWFLD
jgi:hypothetical protein